MNESQELAAAVFAIYLKAAILASKCAHWLLAQADMEERRSAVVVTEDEEVVL